MKRFGLGLLLLLAATTPSQAVTREEPRLQRNFLYPGEVCQPFDSAGYHITYSQTGAANAGGALAVVVCPLPISQTWYGRTLPFGNAGTLIREDIYTPVVKVYDLSSVGDVNCTIRNLDTSGNVIWSSVKSTTSSSFSAYTLAFLVPTPGVLFDEVWDVACVLPGATSMGASRVTSIKLTVEQPPP